MIVVGDALDATYVYPEKMMNGWQMNFPFWVSAYFQVPCLTSGRV